MLSDFGFTIHWIDGRVIGAYLLALIAFSLFLSKRQHSRADYYVGGELLGRGLLPFPQWRLNVQRTRYWLRQPSSLCGRRLGVAAIRVSLKP